MRLFRYALLSHNQLHVDDESVGVALADLENDCNENKALMSETRCNFACHPVLLQCLQCRESGDGAECCTCLNSGSVADTWISD